MFKKMLKPGGILVGPVGDELVKIVRSQSQNPDGNKQFDTRVIAGVRFAPLTANPSIQTVIPARIWDPSNHRMYPNSFRGACNEILLCSNASTNQPVKPLPRNKVNAASMLPRALWVEVLSFTHRNWFDVPMNEVEFLRRRLAEEEANVQRANTARLEAEKRSQVAERERDLYKILARTFRSRLNSALSDGSQNSDDIIEGIIIGGRESFSTGLGGMLRLVSQDRNDEEMEEDGDEDFEFSEGENDDDTNEAMEVAQGDDDEDINDDASISLASENQNPIDGSNMRMSNGLKSQS